MNAPQPARLPYPRLRAAGLAAVTVALTAGLAWPAVDLGGAPKHSDKLLHFAVFAGWSVALLASGLLGPPLGGRTILRAAAVALVYAAASEGVQAIPGVNRHASVWDAAANGAGVAAVIGLALACRSAATRGRLGKIGRNPAIFPDSG